MSRSVGVRPTSFRAAFLAVGAAVLVSGCGFWPVELRDGGSNELKFVNDSDETVHVVYLPQVGGEFDLIPGIEPGRSRSRSDIGPCTAGTLVARNEAGEDVDRRVEPLCQGKTWRIGGEQTAPSG